MQSEFLSSVQSKAIKMILQADYMFEIQEVYINLIYIHLPVKKECLYTWLKMIAELFSDPNQLFRVTI